MACVFPCQQVIVVGGGLAGMVAANTLLENGAKVVLIDKSSFCGGNSTKATGGISGSATRTQKAKGIEDSAELFKEDTLRGGGKNAELAQLLCTNSGSAIEWLMDKFSVDLSEVARFGGHSAPRTYRGKERFPGMVITYALIQMLEMIAERTNKARIICKARATKLLTSEAGACVGVVYEKGGGFGVTHQFQEHGPVILASGGYGADFTIGSLLAKHRPDLCHLSTTNGEHCTGDGIKIGEAIGAKSVDLEWVQVHPTGLVKPDDPDAKIKFLASEALRGVGGILLDAHGNRFVNELGRCDYVANEMYKNAPPFRLCLNKAAAEEIHWHCSHYCGRGVMKCYESGEKLAQDMGIPISTLEATYDAHYTAAMKAKEDPDGGPWPAYPSGKSWDAPSGKTACGKKFYQNTIPGAAVKAEPFWVAMVTPVIHYCMGGLMIDTDSAVLGESGKAIPGVYAAGEVAGGIHGNNRLGGNALLDCVVFGRVAGKAAAKYILGDEMKDTDLVELSGGGLSRAPAAPRPAPPPAAPPPAAPPPVMLVGEGFTMNEVAKHTRKDDCWVVVNGQVLNVTKFLSQHPGGELAILTFGGKDASEEFNMIHPKGTIAKYGADTVIGHLRGDHTDERECIASKASGGDNHTTSKASGWAARPWLALLGAIGNCLDMHPDRYYFNVLVIFHVFLSVVLPLLPRFCSLGFRQAWAAIQVSRDVVLQDAHVKQAVSTLRIALMESATGMRNKVEGMDWPVETKTTDELVQQYAARLQSLKEIYILLNKASQKMELTPTGRPPPARLPVAAAVEPYLSQAAADRLNQAQAGAKIIDRGGDNAVFAVVAKQIAVDASANDKDLVTEQFEAAAAVFEDAAASLKELPKAEGTAPVANVDELVKAYEAKAGVLKEVQKLLGSAEPLNMQLSPAEKNILRVVQLSNTYVHPRTHLQRASLLKGVVLQGSLKKRGPTAEFAWEDRYCTLSSRTLSVFTEATCSELKGDIDISTETRVYPIKNSSAPGDAAKHCKERPFGFVLDPEPRAGKDRKLHYFDAGSAEIQQMWTKTIEDVLLGTYS